MTAESNRDDAYRAVGRYVVEFSRLVFHMRLAVELTLTPEGGDRVPAELALGASGAAQISDVFFSLCEHKASLNADEEAVARKLSRNVQKEISRRNDIAHGDWWVGFGVDESGAMDDPELWRVKPARRAGAQTTRNIPIHELDQWADGLNQLLQYVAEFGGLCLRHMYVTTPTLRVEDIFTIRDGQVVREGPRAADVQVVFR